MQCQLGFYNLFKRKGLNQKDQCLTSDFPSSEDICPCVIQRAKSVPSASVFSNTIYCTCIINYGVGLCVYLQWKMGKNFQSYCWDLAQCTSHCTW